MELQQKKMLEKLFLGNPKADELFGITTPRGFDFYSAHLFLKEVGKIDMLAFGDYHIQLGQGLTFGLV